MKFRYLLLFALVTGCASSSKDPGKAQPPPASPPAVVPASSSMIGTEEAKKLKFFDMHGHYNPWRVKFEAKEAWERMQKAGIYKVLLSTTPNEPTLKMIEVAGDFVVPELRSYKDMFPPGPANYGDIQTWINDPTVPKQLATMLKEKKNFVSLGEFNIYGEEITPTVLAVADLAIKHHKFLHLHCSQGIIEKLLAAKPKVKILWAHAGYVCVPQQCPTGIKDEHPTPELVGQMLDKNPNLFVDISERDSSWQPSATITVMEGERKGLLQPEWRNFVLSHPDRVVLGTDNFSPERWQKLEAIVAEERGWTADMPRDVAEKVAYKNGERLTSR